MSRKHCEKNHHFLLFPQCFQKLSFFRVIVSLDYVVKTENTQTLLAQSYFFLTDDDKSFSGQSRLQSDYIKHAV